MGLGVCGLGFGLGVRLVLGDGFCWALVSGLDVYWVKVKGFARVSGRIKFKREPQKISRR